MIKQLIKENKTGFVISLIAITIFSVIIHVRDYSPPNWDIFFLWLPVVWISFILITIPFWMLIK